MQAWWSLASFENDILEKSLNNKIGEERVRKFCEANGHFSIFILSLLLHFLKFSPNLSSLLPPKLKLTLATGTRWLYRALNFLTFVLGFKCQKEKMLDEKGQKPTSNQTKLAFLKNSSRTLAGTFIGYLRLLREW
jgi:hypothetical protein